MNNYQLILINSKVPIWKDAQRKWTLKPDLVYILGRKELQKEDGSNIDLSFDNSVSRIHAKIWYENNQWWLEDKSKFGINLNGGKIPLNKKHILKSEDIISVGNKTILVFTYGWDYEQFRNIWIGMKGSGTINYALLHNDSPFIEKVRIHNCSNESIQLNLRFVLEKYFDKTITSRMIEQDFSEYIVNNDLNFIISAAMIERQIESCFSYLQVYINNSEIQTFNKKINILTYNEWSMEDNPNHQTSLASFVQYNHHYVNQITADIKNKALKDMSENIRELYNYFHDYCKINYTIEPKNFNHDCQKIRLAHSIFSNWNERKGEATCIDISLLFAACLEDFGLYPLILIFKINDGDNHAITGCRNKRHITSMPLLYKKDVIQEDIFLIDPTGIAAGSSKCPYEQALKNAQDIFNNKELIFALDITAARAYDKKPLPFVGDITGKNGRHIIESSFVQEIDKKAKELSEIINPLYKVYSPIHILIAFFMTGSENTKKAFIQAGIHNLELAGKISEDMLKNIGINSIIKTPVPSINYHRTFSEAIIIAKQENSGTVNENHLLYALLRKSDSEALNNVFDALCKDFSLKIDGSTLKMRISSFLNINIDNNIAFPTFNKN